MSTDFGHRALDAGGHTEEYMVSPDSSLWSSFSITTAALIGASGAGLVTERRDVVVSCGADEEIALAFLMRPLPISDSD
jgi:hypothetical protein